MDEKQPLYTCIPQWIAGIVETKKCYKCKNKVSRKDICAIGIRTFREDQNTVYVEHLCPKCKSRTVTSFAKEKLASVEDLCYMLIEQIHNKRRIRKSQHLEGRCYGDRIEDKEVESLIKFMEEAKSFEEVLKYIGSPDLPPGMPTNPEKKDES